MAYDELDPRTGCTTGAQAATSVPPYFSYWGKARPLDAQGAAFHLLPYHCLDVAAVAAAWWDLDLNLQRQFGELVQSAADSKTRRAWVLFFVALHDLGKFDVRFQMKSLDALTVLQPTWNAHDLPDRDEASRYEHGECGLRWFIREHPHLLGMQDKDECLVDIWMPWLAAVAGHHGRIPRHRHPVHPPDAEAKIIDHDRLARRAWLLALAELFLAPSGLKLADGPPLLHQDHATYLAGFCAVCDWLGSNETWFAYRSDIAASPGGYFDDRVAMVTRERLLQRCGLIAPPSPYLGVKALLGPDESPRQLQTLVDALPATAGVTLIEAPTGSGKTETALAYAWRLLDAGLADSIVFALPTQATANAMWERLNRFADTLFGKGSNLVLAHGKARWHDGHSQLREAARQPSVQEADDIRVQCAEWLAESRKRVFLGQIGVCTIDQVLLSVLPLRHKFVRGFGVMKSVLVVDEVHAYDRYMYGLLDGVLRQQRRAGGSAVLLSATLPHELRCRLARAWNAVDPPDANAPYPLLTRVDAAGRVFFTELNDPDQRPPARNVQIECRPEPDTLPDRGLIERIVEAAAAGAHVAIVCNLVNDAQGLARLLKAETELPVDLFHARFRFLDRQLREQEVLTKYGRNAERLGGRILVATQVVEQSLDLDFDWLITQICPVDLLFQRMGRLHRHDRSRPPGFERPRCTVLVPPAAEYGLHKLVYGNTRVLWRTQQLLQGVDHVDFPAAYRTWIERVYERDDWPDEPENIAFEYEKFRAEENANFDRAQVIANDDMNPLADNDENVRALTRDGEMSLAVILIDAEGRLIGEHEPIAEVDEWERRERIALSAVGVPASWKGKLPAQDDDGLVWLTVNRKGSTDWVGRGVDTSFRYSREYGLQEEGAQ
nr:CRISPR-associated helicase/endonuclease Cas3 [uncultured Caldimonas sp.]